MKQRQKGSSRPPPIARKIDERQSGSGGHSGGGAAKAAFEGIFRIDSKFLNSEFELKKIFGSKVINYERRFV